MCDYTFNILSLLDRWVAAVCRKLMLDILLPIYFGRKYEYSSQCVMEHVSQLYLYMTAAGTSVG